MSSKKAIKSRPFFLPTLLIKKMSKSVKSDLREDAESTLYEKDEPDLKYSSNHNIFRESVTDINSDRAEKYDLENGGLDSIERIPTSNNGIYVCHLHNIYLSYL